MLPDDSLQAQDNLKKIEAEIKSCRKCPLAGLANNYVVGEGNSEAKILFVGEAPGRNEDLEGRPFCGKAGRVLDGLLAASGYKRESIYITNILKCRPPKNRNPKPEEVYRCTPYLIRQIKVIRPKIICCLGNSAISFIMNKFNLGGKLQGVGKIHGRVFMPRDSNLFKIIPLYHPASAVYNPGMVNTLRRDFVMLKNVPV